MMIYSGLKGMQLRPMSFIYCRACGKLQQKDASCGLVDFVHLSSLRYILKHILLYFSLLFPVYIVCRMVLPIKEVYFLFSFPIWCITCYSALYFRSFCYFKFIILSCELLKIVNINVYSIDEYALPCKAASFYVIYIFSMHFAFLKPLPVIFQDFWICHSTRSIVKIV